MSTVDSLVVELGVKSDSLMDGLNRAISAIEGFSSKLEGVGKALDSIVSRFPDLGESAEKGTDKARQGVRGLGQEVRRTGEAAEGAARKMADSFNKVSPTLSKLKALLVGYFGTRAMFGVAQRGTELNRFGIRTGIDSSRVDAWAKATEKAGGSGQALRDALKEWKIHGRSEEDFFAMNDMMKGMNGQERSWFLKSRGVNESAGAAFMIYGDRAKEVAEGYKSVAITPAQQKLAQDFVDAFYDLQVYVEAIGRKVGNVILPIATNIFKRTKAFLDVLLKDGKTIEKLTIGIGAIIALKWVVGLASAYKTLKGITVLQKLFNALSLANPFGLVVLAIGAALLFLEDFMTYLKGGDSLCRDIENKLKGWALAFASFMDEFEKSFQTFVFGVADKIATAIRSGFETAYNGICDVFKNIYAFVYENLISPIEKFFGGIADKVKGIKSFFGFGDDNKAEVAKENVYNALRPNDYSSGRTNPTAGDIVTNNTTSSRAVSNEHNTTNNIHVEVNAKDTQSAREVGGFIATKIATKTNQLASVGATGVTQ